MQTNKYSVTDMDRVTEHGRGVPGTSHSSLSSNTRELMEVRGVGIFFKYDIEPMSLTIRERTTSLIQFLVRLAGIIGGVLGKPLYLLATLLQ